MNFDVNVFDSLVQSYDFIALVSLRVQFQCVRLSMGVCVCVHSLCGLDEVDESPVGKTLLRLGWRRVSFSSLFSIS